MKIRVIIKNIPTSQIKLLTVFAATSAMAMVPAAIWSVTRSSWLLSGCPLAQVCADVSR